MRLINEILNLLLGYKYRAVILKDCGVQRYWICSYIFEDTPAGRKRQERYLNTLKWQVAAHEYVETVTFRSRHGYTGQMHVERVADLPRRNGKKTYPEMFREKRTPIEGVNA